MRPLLLLLLVVAVSCVVGETIEQQSRPSPLLQQHSGDVTLTNPIIIDPLSPHSPSSSSSRDVDVAASNAVAGIVTPTHLATHEESHTIVKRTTKRRRTNNKSTSSSSTTDISKPTFTPAPWPYSVQAPQCKTYARQDNCVNDPPLSSNPLPPCGNFSSATDNTTVWAIVGDFGIGGQCLSEVASLIMKMQSQFAPNGQFAFVMTTGDNAYWTGSCEALSQAVGTYFTSFLPNGSSPQCTDPGQQYVHGLANPHWKELKLVLDIQKGERKLRHEKRLQAKERKAKRKQQNKKTSNNKLRSIYTDEDADNSSSVRFFPTIGNHDWNTYGPSDPTGMPYLQVFDYLVDLPPSAGQGQFYLATPVPGVELYSLNSNLGDPDGSSQDQALFQASVDWLQTTLQNSTASFKFVFFHHPPFCTAQHDALSPWMDLPYEDWGVSAVFSGHEHVYERLARNSATKSGDEPTMPYIVNGLGGHPWTYTITGCPPYPGSQFRYNAFHGAQLVIQSWDQATQAEKLDVCFYSMENGGSMIDSFELQANPNNN